VAALHDLAEVRARLERNRAWAAFSIADLDPAFAAHAAWFGPELGSSVVLVYDAYDPPILFCQGEPSECDAVLRETALVARTPRAYLNVTDDLMPVAQRHFATFERRLMVRMVLEGEAPRVSTAVERLGPADLAAVQALYAEDPPAFFLPGQLQDGVYFGIREGEELVAVAGTHVLSASGGVGAIGNVHTRSDRRGRGLAAAVTSAVAAELRRMAISTIVLNIVDTNHAARRVYERIGFREYCRFYEGRAQRSEVRSEK
jgi:ribosomal protein S18 acetylase RimI-like enzyme